MIFDLPWLFRYCLKCDFNCFIESIIHSKPKKPFFDPLFPYHSIAALKRNDSISNGS